MEIIKRNHCIVTNSNDLQHLYTYHNFPVFMGCTYNSESNDVRADMTWMISKSSGLIQLESLIPLEVLYQESHGAGCVGNSWDKHHLAFAEYIHKFTPSSVFEIGGHHGILAKKYMAFGEIPWTIIEPNPSPVADTPAKFIRGFFNNEFKCDEEYDVIVHSHVLEHIYEPDVFMGYFSHFIENGKYLIFSIPNLMAHMERKYTYCIGFEHSYFLTEPYIEFLLAKHGFQLIEKKYYLEDHSIFYSAKRDSSVKPIKLNENLYKINKKIFHDYIKFHTELIADINQKINSTQQPVFLFGAHALSQILISFGIQTERIKCLLDNDINKQGKRLYGTSFKVCSPKILQDFDKPAVILRMGVFNNEIKNDILKINPNVVFWE